MDKNVFVTVAAPTLVSAGGAPFIAITSHGTSDSFIEKIIRAKRKDGSSIINHVDFDLVCNKCKRKKLAEGEDACRHKKGELPWWHSSKRHDDLEALLEGKYI
jgi:pyruvate/2-oxoacid:ferredoxin oxidoreductase beta subunit